MTRQDNIDKTQTWESLTAEVLRLRRAQSDLKESEVFSRAVFEASQTGLLVVDPRTCQIMDANTAAAEILNHQPGCLIGLQASDFMLADHVKLVDLPENQSREFETLMIAQGGSQVPVIRSIKYIEGDQTELAVISFLDISYLKQAEAEIRSSHEKLRLANEDLKRHKDQIVQSEKLASIGQLAAGVAHEINNPIGFVTSNLGTVQEYFASLTKILCLYEQRDATAADDTDSLAELAAAIVAAKEEEDLEFIIEDLSNVVAESLSGVNRVAEIVQNLKSFAREDSNTLVAYDVNEGVESMIKMAWNELKYSCEVDRAYGDLPEIACHAGRINQVIMNMLVNAAQAMPESGGKITVGTAVTDDEVIITIADTGSGMSPETVSRIFDPFFTTKEVGSGTGLGLSISHGIIQEHNGRIEVESVVGEGTTFYICLPLTAAPSTESTTAELIG